MSGVSVIRYTLANNATLTATVPATRIMAGVLPINVTLPAISVSQISGIERKNIKQSSSELQIDRVQVTVLASTYAQQKSVLQLVKDALPSVRATVNSIEVDSITQDSTGPDFYSDDPIIYEQSIDYIVRYMS